MSKNQTQAPHGEIYKQFGNNIARCRSALGLSQSEAAARLNMPQSTYSGYESGTRKVPLSVIVQIADFYNVTPDDLINGDLSSLASDAFSLSPLEEQIIKRFRLLPDGERNMILRSLGLEEESKKDGVITSAV